MMWLLQLANPQCPCLGLTRNELRELLFSCIKGAIRAIRERISISAPKGEIPSRHVLPATWLLSHCNHGASGCEIRGTQGTIRSGQREGWGSGFCRAGRQRTPQRDASHLYINHLFLLPPFPPASWCLVNLLPTPQAAFLCYSLTLGLARLHFFLEWLYLEALEKEEREKEKLRLKLTPSAGCRGWLLRPPSKRKRFFCPVMYLYKVSTA